MVRTSLTSLDKAAVLLSVRLQNALMSVEAAEREHMTELRLRAGRYFSAVLYGKEYFVTRDGRLMNSPEQAEAVTPEDVRTAFTAAFKGSVHAYPRELAQGWITVEGGNRVGFCGTAVCGPTGREITSVRDISSVVIRLARQVKGCADRLYEQAFSEGAVSLIIASPPCGGKTTVLRDLCRRLGERYRVCIADERGEIACMENCTAQNDIGLRCDVLDGYPKADAVITAVRTLSPEIVVCDEIGTKDDIAALEYAVNSGVKLVCTCHAPDIPSLRKRRVSGRLIKSGVFDYAAVLGTGSMCGRLISFSRLKE